MRHRAACALGAILLALVAASVEASPSRWATPGEARPDCERGQEPPWGTTDPAAPEEVAPETGIRLRACEGEHWDGQNPVNGSGWDPNGANEPTPSSPSYATAHPRSGNSSREAYASAGAYSVGALSVYAGSCSKGAGEGLDGRAGKPPCRVGALGAGEAMAAVHLRDDTPGNLVYTAVVALRLTQGYVAEGDCTYEEARPRPIGTPCARDNTAVTVEAVA